MSFMPFHQNKTATIVSLVYCVISQFVVKTILLYSELPIISFCPKKNDETGKIYLLRFDMIFWSNLPSIIKINSFITTHGILKYQIQ